MFDNEICRLIIFLSFIVFIIVLYFIKSKPDGNESKPAYNESDFEIEHYPLSKIYYAKYKGKYLDTEHITGIIKLKGDFYYCDQHGSIEDADKKIAKFKEQQFKENVIIIKR